jgi:hypothetical protein
MSTIDLTDAQLAALAHVRAAAASEREAALRRCEAVLGAQARAPELAAAIATHGRITLNFHPDRLLADGRTVARALAEDRLYRNQFETRISSGSRTAFAGGERDRWEEKLFGGAYQREAVAPRERPKYGALDLLGHPDGAAPRFGSCHLRLRPELALRSTFCFGDSHLGPRDVGTSDELAGVLAGLLAAVRDTGVALGRAGVDVAALCSRILAGPPTLAAEHGRSLDDYIEAQVHGEVRVPDDIEAIVADPSFRGTEIERELARLGAPLVWHAGFELAVDEVPAELRGPRIPLFARRVAGMFAADRVDAALIGRAAASLHREPGTWQDWAGFEDTLQHIKQLWHVLVHLGRAAGR